MTDDHAAIGRVIDDLYRSISGPAGPRNWDLAAEVFHPDSRQARTGVEADGRAWIKIMGREQYRADTQPFFDVTDFFEVEVERRIDVFGNMAHVWSVYEARNAADDPTPERRGINSIQLYRQPDGRWRVLHMIWDNEREGLTARL